MEVNLFVFILTFSMFLIIFLKVKNSNYIKKYFLWFSGVTTFWLFCNLLLMVFNNFFFFKIAYSAGAIAINAGLIFIIAFVSNKNVKKRVIIPVIIICLFLIIACMIDNVFFIENEGTKTTVGYTPFFNFYSFYLFSIIIFIVFHLMFSIRKMENNKKIQIKFIFTGSLIFALSSFVPSFILPAIFHIQMFREYTILGPLALIGFSFYAIISLTFQEKEKLKSEMVVAEQIQTAILPKLNYNYQDLEIDAIMKPAEQVGGDYYDIITDKKNDLWLAIGDVTGHGITSGIISMIAQTCLMTNLLENIAKSTYEVILSINNTLHENIRNRLHESHFMTFSLLKYFGDGEFEQSGSHLDIIIYRNETKECEIIKTEGVYLGIMNRAENAIKTKRFKLQQNDIMILFTDGITEARNENQKCLNQNFIYDVLKKTQNITLIKNLVLQKSLDWCNNKQDDDMTLIVVKRR